MFTSSITCNTSFYPNGISSKFDKTSVTTVFERFFHVLPWTSRLHTLCAKIKNHGYPDCGEPVEELLFRK